MLQVKDVVAWLDGVFADEYLPNDLDEQKRSRILQCVCLSLQLLEPAPPLVVSVVRPGTTSSLEQCGCGSCVLRRQV